MKSDDRMPEFSFRPATSDDLAITYALTEDAMRSYVEQTWGAWEAEEQLAKHRANFTPETHQLILVDGVVAGLVAVEDLATHLWLVKLYLFQRYRRAGIGSRVLQSVLADARASGKPVRLRVLKVNQRARALYERLGFRVIDEAPERFFMESPSAGLTPSASHAV